MYVRTYPYVESVTIHNESTQNIQWSPFKNPSQGVFDTLVSKSYLSMAANPLEIYVKRTSDVGSPPVITIDIIYWTEEQIKETMTWWQKLFSGILTSIMPGAPSEPLQVKTRKDTIVMTPDVFKDLQAKTQSENAPTLFGLPLPPWGKKKEGA